MKKKASTFDNQADICSTHVLSCEFTLCVVLFSVFAIDVLMTSALVRSGHCSIWARRSQMLTLAYPVHYVWFGFRYLSLCVARRTRDALRKSVRVSSAASVRVSSAASACVSLTEINSGILPIESQTISGPEGGLNTLL